MTDPGVDFHQAQAAAARLDYEKWRNQIARSGGEPPPVAAFEAAAERTKALTDSWSNPAYRRARLAEQAAGAEAERAARPHPRIVLRAAHQRRAEAQAEVAAAQAACDKAAEFLRLAEGRLAGIERTLGERRAGVVARLADQFRGLAGGSDNIPERLGPLKASQIQAQTEVETAKAAHDKLAAELTAAQTTLRRAEAGVFGAVVEVLVHAAEDRAEEIRAAEAALHEQRISLDALARCVAEKERAQGRPVLTQFPPPVWEALHDANGRLLVTGAQMGDVAPWRSVIDDLAADPEAHSALAPLRSPAASE